MDNRVIPGVDPGTSHDGIVIIFLAYAVAQGRDGDGVDFTVGPDDLGARGQLARDVGEGSTMPDDLLIELNAPAYARLRAMMAFYGDSSPDTMISRALGLLEMLEPYVGPDGVLTVVNPNPERNGEGAEVDLVFDNMLHRRDQPGAAA